MVDVTCWTLIESAAAGDRGARDDFVRRYLPVVRAYLESRWRKRLSRMELDDAAQEVFVECLKVEGVLDKNRARRGSGFRAYLLAVVRNIALRVEESRARRLDRPETDSFHGELLPASGDTSSRIFDRAWAAAIMREAAEKQNLRAQAEGAPALRRVELLRLLFQEERRIAEVADEWDVPPAELHREYAKARSEFAAALRDVVAFHTPESDAAVERECRELMALLE